MNGIKIIGTGSYLPEFVVTNDDFTAFVDTSDEWIKTRTGMNRRHISLGEPAWYMGALSAQKAIETAGISPLDIDAIIVTTATSEYYFPSCACLLQKHIGAKNAFSMDIGVACAGLTYSLDMARRYLATGDVKTVLLVSCENLTQLTDYTDRATCVLFGDGAGALVVQAGENTFASYLLSETEGLGYIYDKRERRKLPFEKEASPDLHEPFPIAVYDHLFMAGRDVYKYATRLMPQAVKIACERANIAIEELDLIIPHQANLRILETVAKNLGVSMDKIYLNIEECGNTSSATIPIGLDDCVRSGRINRGDKVCLVGFGSGLTLGANVFIY